jgi:hypothetical protein
MDLLGIYRLVPLISGVPRRIDEVGWFLCILRMLMRELGRGDGGL